MPPKRRRRFQGLYYHSSPPKVLSMNGKPSNPNLGKRRDVDDFSIKLSTIRIWMHEKDIGKLTRVLWAGQGSRLRQQASNNSKVKRFLAAVPYAMNSIKDVHQTVIDNNLETLQTYLEPPVPAALITCKDANGLNVIHKAAGLGHATILEYLIGVWPDGVQETDITGKTPLHWAASCKNNMRCYTLLTEAGADEEALDYKLKTPSYYRHKPQEIERAFLVFVPDAPRVSPDVATDWEALGQDSSAAKIKIPETIANGLQDRPEQAAVEGESEKPEKEEEGKEEEGNEDEVVPAEEQAEEREIATKDGDVGEEEEERKPESSVQEDEEADKADDEAGEVGKEEADPADADDDNSQGAEGESGVEDLANGKDISTVADDNQENGAQQPDVKETNENNDAGLITTDENNVEKDVDEDDAEKVSVTELKEDSSNQSDNETESNVITEVQKEDKEDEEKDDKEGQDEENIDEKLKGNLVVDPEQNVKQEAEKEEETNDEEMKKEETMNEELKDEEETGDEEVKEEEKGKDETQRKESNEGTEEKTKQNSLEGDEAKKVPLEQATDSDKDVHDDKEEEEANNELINNTESDDKPETEDEDLPNAQSEIITDGQDKQLVKDNSDVTEKTDNETDKEESTESNNENPIPEAEAEEEEVTAEDRGANKGETVDENKSTEDTKAIESIDNEIVEQKNEENKKRTESAASKGNSEDLEQSSEVLRTPKNTALGRNSVQSANERADDESSADDDDDDDQDERIKVDISMKAEVKSESASGSWDGHAVLEIDHQHEEKSDVNSITSALAIEGFVQGESEDNTVQSLFAADVDEDSISIQDVIASGELEQLARIVLNGDGNKLLHMQSTEPEIQAFLDNVPNYMNKIHRVHAAAREGDILGLQKALDRRKFAIAKDEISPNGASPLHVAVLFGHTDIVRYLAGRFPETTSATDVNGRTALHYAATIKDNGHFYNVLTQLGANPKTVDKFGHSSEYLLSIEGTNDILTYRQLLEGFGAAHLEQELLSDQVPDDLHSSRRLLRDGTTAITLDRCFHVIQESSKVLSGATASALAYRKPLSSSALQVSVTSYLSRFLKPSVFLKIKKRQTRLDHNLFDVIWPAMRRATRMRHLEEDINCGIVAPDFDVYVVFQEFLVPLIKDMHCLSIDADFKPHSRLAFFPMENGERLNTASFVFDDESNLLRFCVVECSRNLDRFELPLNLSIGQIEQAERLMMSKLYNEKFRRAIGDKEAGNYYTLSEIVESDSEVRSMLTNLGLMIPLFDNEDPVQASESAAFNGSIWPYGRGVFVSVQNNMALWLNCHEHLRVIASTPTTCPTNLGAVYTRVGRAVCYLERELHFRESYLLGYLQARPSYLGTGLKMFTTLNLPNLVKEMDNLRHLCAVRGLNLITTRTEPNPAIRLVNMQSLGTVEYVLFQDYCTAVTSILSLEKDMSLSNSKHIASMLVKIFRRKKTSLVDRN